MIAYKMKCLRFILLLLISLPIWVSGQTREPWKTTIEIKDRRKNNETPVVAKATLSAWWMTSRLTKGDPILRGSDGLPEPIQFQGQLESYIKFKIESIEFVDPKFDKTPEFKVIMRSMWVDMSPRPYEEKRGDLAGLSDAQKRKLFVTAPNMEHEYNDSLPPPIIFKIDRSNRYTFTLGFTALTTETVKEKPWPFSFTFVVNGLLRNGEGWGEPEEPVVKETVVVVDTPKTKAPEPEVDTDEIDAAVARAIAEEDVETLKELMGEYPKVQSVIDAKPYLELAMRRELIDSSTYLVDIYYKRFSRALPTKEDLSLAMSHRGQPFPSDGVLFWREGKLYARPPRDSTTYRLTATHNTTPENKAFADLNSNKDFITFSYVDTLEGEYVRFRINGGKRPYALHAQMVTGDYVIDIEGLIKVDGDTLISKDRIARLLRIKEEGDFQFFVEDSDQLKKTGVGTVHIIPPPLIPPIVWYISGILSLLGFIIFLILRREKRRKDEEMEKLLASRGGKDPRVKRKPKPDLKEFWKETAISELSLHKNFIRDVSTYLKERPRNRKSDVSMIEGVILGTVLKFDFETEQYEVRLDKFRAMDAMPLDYYEEKPGMDRWPAIREISQDHKDLVKIGWLQVVNGRAMALQTEDLKFMDEQFSELFQLCLKIDIEGKERYCGFFTRTVSGKINNAKDRKPGVDYWLDWDKLEDAGYYEANPKTFSMNPEQGSEPAFKSGKDSKPV